MWSQRITLFNLNWWFQNRNFTFNIEYLIHSGKLSFFNIEIDFGFKHIFCVIIYFWNWRQFQSYSLCHFLLLKLTPGNAANPLSVISLLSSYIPLILPLMFPLIPFFPLILVADAICFETISTKGWCQYVPCGHVFHRVHIINKWILGIVGKESTPILK